MIFYVHHILNTDVQWLLICNNLVSYVQYLSQITETQHAAGISSLFFFTIYCEFGQDVHVCVNGQSVLGISQQMSRHYLVKWQ